MTEENEEQRGEASRRRRGSRGGRGRGAAATATGVEREPVRPVTNIEEPRIVGRRPGRAAESVATTPESILPPPAAAPIAEVEPEAPAAPRTRTRRAPAAAPAIEAGTEGIAALLAEQARTMEALRAEVAALSSKVENSARRARVGIFVDVPNLLYGAERGERIECVRRSLTPELDIRDDPTRPAGGGQTSHSQSRLRRGAGRPVGWDA